MGNFHGKFLIARHNFSIFLKAIIILIKVLKLISKQKET